MSIEHRDTDEGAVSAELVIASPLAMFLLLLVVHFGVWLHAVHIADTAAAQALTAARAEDGTAQAGRQRAADVLAQLGDGVLHVDSIDVRRDAARGVTVRIDGASVQVVPFLRMPVQATAAGPIDQFLAPPNR